jgi:geranylgeranyl pyrophosphate synthase
MYDLAGEHELNLEAIRARLRHMSDRELLRFGKSARYMCSTEANLGKKPRPVFVIQLREAEKEWRRREQART